MDHVQGMLETLKNRLQRQGVTLNEFYVDNCCALRQKLQQIFGSHMKVFLDIFHAVQRISKQIPKKHPYNSVFEIFEIGFSTVNRPRKTQNHALIS